MCNLLFQIKTDTTSIINDANEVAFISYWFWIALCEFAFIIYLIIRLKSKKSKLAFSDLGKESVKNAKTQSIDMENLMDSINGARTLYKELSRKCHPDRFVNTPKEKIAQEIFQEITKNQRNFEKLTLLKEKAINSLNINF